MTRATITPGSIAVPVTDRVTVAYHSALNMVEVMDRGQVVRSEIAPAGYTAAAFTATVDRVREFYAAHIVTLS